MYKSVPRMHEENQESGARIVLNGSTRDCFEGEENGAKKNDLREI